MQSIEAASGTEGKDHPDHHVRLVEVKIDGREIEIAAQVYRVPDLKTRLGVPLDYELELIKGGQFHPLADDQTYSVHGHEEFLSHVRCGASS